MSRNSIVRTLLVFAVSIIVCRATQAVNAADHITHGRFAESPFTHPNEKAKPALATIYSNLGSSTDTYDDTHGWYVAGSNSSLGGSQWIAMPFSPKRNSTVTQIKIAVGYISGSNGFTVCLGYPGPSNCVRTRDLTSLPTFGTCCKLDVELVKPGYKVTKGKKYWVVAMTDAANSDTLDAWDFTWNDSIGSMAYNDNNQGWNIINSYVGAFGVFGTIP